MNARWWGSHDKVRFIKETWGACALSQRVLDKVPAEVIGKLQAALAGLKLSDYYKEIVEPRDIVLARFQPAFHPEHVANITEDEFRSFLLLENNRHWSGLHRQGPRLCADTERLREGLSILVDETQPIDVRLDQAMGLVAGMGKNIATAILLISQPHRYGVWNNRSEAAMKRLGIWPEFDRGEPFGSRYIKVNEIMLELCEKLQTDLWTLDALWYYLDQMEVDGLFTGGDSGAESNDAPRFGLERHLHEFLRDNWNRLELGREWTIHQEPGDEEAGFEYQCDNIGRIDLLARHKTRKDWLVVELKRNQSSDQTVGQLLRYIGWVKNHMAEDGEEVYGLIICHEPDEALHYALSTLSNIDLWLYRVEFYFEKPKRLGANRS